MKIVVAAGKAGVAAGVAAGKATIKYAHRMCENAEILVNRAIEWFASVRT